MGDKGDATRAIEMCCRSAATPSSLFQDLKRELLTSEQAKAGVYDQRVVSGAATFVNLGERGLDAASRAVRAVAGHGLNRVGHRENARLQPNGGTRQAVRITRTIQALVMLPDNSGYRPWKIDLL